jgi:hypothetical protein
MVVLRSYLQKRFPPIRASAFEIKESAKLQHGFQFCLSFIFTANALLISPSLLPSKALSTHSSPFYLILRRALLRSRWGSAKAYFNLALWQNFNKLHYLKHFASSKMLKRYLATQ